MNQIERFHYNSDRIRGSIINWTINLERSIDSYISKHFLTDKKKRLELMELVVSDRVSFFEKTQILKEILTNKCLAQKKYSVKNIQSFLMTLEKYKRIETDLLIT